MRSVCILNGRLYVLKRTLNKAISQICYIVYYKIRIAVEEKKKTKKVSSDEKKPGQYKVLIDTI